MISETTSFIKTIREIYLVLGKNYTPYLKLDALSEGTVDLNSIFHPRLKDAYVSDTRRLSSIAGSDTTQAGLNFTDDFDFRVSDCQKAHGTQLVTREITREIRELKGDDRPVTIVSLGIGDGATALSYARDLDLDGADAMIGMDLHSAYLEDAEQRIPGIETRRFDLNRLSKGECLPIEGQSADIVECTMVAHHIEDFISLVSETRRILKPGGSFFYLDLIDKTAIEEEMAFSHDHDYPPFHGVEFFRDHHTVKKIMNRYLLTYLYSRVGPGILFSAAMKS